MKTLIAIAAALLLAGSAAVPPEKEKIRLVPTVIADDTGQIGFTWIATADKRDILVCFSMFPVGKEVVCHINMGTRYKDSMILVSEKHVVKVIEFKPVDS